MNFPAGLRDRRPIFTPTHYSIANYCTDTKNDMRTTFREDLFKTLQLIPDPLKKNLADTLITEEKNMPKNEYRSNGEMKTSDNSQNRAEYSPLSGISNFISGVFSVISGAMFSKRKPSDYVSDDDGQMAVPNVWQSAKSGDENKISVIENCGSDASGALPVDEMSECRAAVAHCQNKLHQVRLLLSQPVPCTSRLRRRPKKVFVEPNSVEDNFEDAFSPEDFENLSNNSYLEYVSPALNQSYDFIEIDAPKTKVEVSCVENTDIVQNLPEVKTNNKEVLSPVITNKKEELVASCEDKLSKLKALLQERRQKPKLIEPESVSEIKETEKPIKTLNKVKDKKHKNPHRGTDKRKRTTMRKSIQDDLVFANEVYMEELSSVENSPLAKNLDNIFTQQTDLGNDYFDEVSGCFHSTSLPDSEDSYQIVLNDTPKRVRRPSDCESEDSFIVFEDSPDMCYTSNDVFGDTSDSDSSDSDYSDSGCGTYMSKLSHSLSKSVSNLTDDSLYANVSEDEVDCSRLENLSICETLPAVTELSHGLLLDSKKKEKRKDQPSKSVRFSEEPPKVHVMRVWAFAARQARAGHWERFAIDRERFKRRIADVDVAVSWVLKPQHRSRVMFQRFMPWWNAQKRQELAEKKQKEEEERIRQEKQGIDDKQGTVGSVDVNVQEVGGELVEDHGVAKEDITQPERYVLDTNGEKDNKEQVTDKDKPAILKHQDSMRLIPKRIEKDIIDVNVNANENDVKESVANDNEMIRTIDSEKSVNVNEITMNHTQCLENNTLNNPEQGSEIRGLELNNVEIKLMNGRPNNQIVPKDDKILKIGSGYVTHIVKDT